MQALNCYTSIRLSYKPKIIVQAPDYYTSIRLLYKHQAVIQHQTIIETSDYYTRVGLQVAAAGGQLSLHLMARRAMVIQDTTCAGILWSAPGLQGKLRPLGAGARWSSLPT